MVVCAVGAALSIAEVTVRGSLSVKRAEELAICSPSSESTTGVMNPRVRNRGALRTVFELAAGYSGFSGVAIGKIASTNKDGKKV